MKKIFFILSLVFSVIVYGQAPPGYTLISARYQWLAGKFQALNIPSGGSPALTTGQSPMAGGMWLDSTTDKLYFYDAGWIQVGGSFYDSTLMASVKRLKDTAAAIRSAIVSGSTPTLQQVLTAGATMTGNNTVAVGSHNFNFTLNGLNNWSVDGGLSNTISTTPIANVDGYLQISSVEDNFLSRNASSNAYAGVTITPTSNVSMIQFNGTGEIDSISLSHQNIRIISDNVYTKVFAPSGSTDSAFYRDAVTGKMKYGLVTGGGGGNTIYTADDALASDRTVDLNSKTLRFSQGGNDFIRVDPSAFSSKIYGIDGTAESKLDLKGNLVGNFVSFELNSDDGTNAVNILGDAQAQTITYTADKHTFNIVDTFLIYNGSADLLRINNVAFTATLRATDGTQQAVLDLESTTDAIFTLFAEDGINPQLSVEGNATTGIITITTANGLALSQGSTGATTVVIGTNSPATLAATGPYTWFKMVAPDGTTVFVPGWK